MLRKGARNLVLCGLTAALLLAVAGTALGQKTTIKGLIVGRDGPNVIIKSQEGNQVTVALDDSTKVQAIKGKLGIRRSDMGFTALIPGLPVEVDAEGPPNQLVAKNIKFKASDLKTANQIQAGLTPTEQQLATTQGQVQANQQQLHQQQQQLQAQNAQIEANQQKIMANQQQIQQTQSEQAALAKRFGELGDYDVKGTATVYFTVNSSKVDAKGQQALQGLATQAKQIGTHYMIQVAGYTDSSGNAQYNQQLSDKRADAVIAYLQQSCGVPLFRVLSPAAMGMSNPAASNESAKGMAENRRVVVKVLVNKGLAGTS
jgi:outer membrane protein OmpA-like peptidoglycan-associated protein